MAKAAVIRHVADAAGNFAEAAPGHRFNLYFPIWGENWQVVKTAKTQAIRETTAIPQEVGKVLAALRARQQALVAAYPGTLSIPAVSTAPFATGLGNEHPVENGFAFLTPYGLPYLAGSGVKGVLRKAAEELALFPEEYALTPEEGGLSMLDVWWLFGFEGAAGAWWSLTRKEERELSDEQKRRRAAWKTRFEAHIATLAERPDLPDFICRAVTPGNERADFLAEPRKFLEALARRRQDIHLRGALDFWDVFPDPEGCKLVVEIMTPHYTDYYQRGATPHDAGQPNPIPFLAVPAGSAFDFHVVCHVARLPESLRDAWQPLLQYIFRHACDWLGFGAKTAVGYGAMTSPNEVPAPTTERPEQPRTEVKPVTATPEIWQGAHLTWIPGQQALRAIIQGKRPAECRGDQARRLLEKLPEDRRATLVKKGLGGIQVSVRPVGNGYELVDLL